MAVPLFLIYSSRVYLFKILQSPSCQTRTTHFPVNCSHQWAPGHTAAASFLTLSLAFSPPLLWPLARDFILHLEDGATFLSALFPSSTLPETYRFTHLDLTLVS